MDPETLDAIASHVAQRFRLRLGVMQDTVQRTDAEIREARRQLEMLRADNQRLRSENARLKAPPVEDAV